MLDLHSPRWAELQHAYGPAADIPQRLAALQGAHASDSDHEPWLTLWSSLAHQGEVYSASFAAVPHVVAALAANPAAASADFFQFPAWIEICRARQAADVPADLVAAYTSALARLPGLVGIASQRAWNDGFAACALAAIAAAKGHHALAEAALEMSTSELAGDVLDWLAER